MPPLKPQNFVSKRKRSEARERQSVEEYFINLYGLMGHETPLQADQTGQMLPSWGILAGSIRANTLISIKHTTSYCAIGTLKSGHSVRC